MQELQNGSPSANILTALRTDEYFARTDSSGAANFLADAFGSTLALTNSSGSLTTQYSYDPFGKVTVSGQTSANPYQFTGRENDGTGLYYYRFRYYHPTLQRFTKQDPNEFGGGDANLYAYVFNSPLNFVDPLGLYFDFNVTIPFGYEGGAVTGGVQIGSNGISPYGGGGFSPIGPPSGSITWGPGPIVPGWQTGFQVNFPPIDIFGVPIPFAGQYGESPQGTFWEIGVGFPPGVSSTGYYVRNLWCPWCTSQKPCK